MRPNKRPLLEILEDRMTPATAGYDGAGNLVFTGDVGTSNLIYINTNNLNNVLVQDNGVKFTDGGNPFVIAPGTHVIIFGGNANDSIQLSGTAAGEIYGGDGADSIISGSGNDVIFCGAGNDIADGGAGNDVVVGEAGADKLHATAGNDILVGGSFIPGSHNGGDWDYNALSSLGASWASTAGGVVGATAASTSEVGDASMVTNPSMYVSDPTTLGERDTLYCGSGHDWVFAASNDILSGLNTLTGGDYRSTP